MSEVETIDQAIEREFELVSYTTLTQDELRKSNYPDSKFCLTFMNTVDGNSKYNYSFDLVRDHPHSPYLVVLTEKRTDFLRKGSERDAEEALKEIALTIRTKTGGYFGIHPFYGAIQGTHFNPILTDFCKGAADEKLSTIIYLTKNGRIFDNDLTKEAVSIGTTITIPGPNAKRLLDYMENANKCNNPNQQNRDQAITNRLGEKWDVEFEKYNPPLKRRGLIARIFDGREEDIPLAMDVTQKSVADFMDYLEEELEFSDLRTTQTDYKRLTLVKFNASTLPRGKVRGIFDKHYNKIELFSL